MQYLPTTPLFRQLQQVIKGKDETLKEAIICLLAGGHLLIEDIPGVGKTTLAYALAKSIGGKFSRIQFTSDLLPSDILGVSVFKAENQAFEFMPGPLFANVVLADEINRTTPKTQSSLLECMERSHISVDGLSMDLPQPFMVVATQNPLDFEGTYPLPENQLDRFLMRITMGYPDEETEKEIIRTPNYHYDDMNLEPAITPDAIRIIQSEVGQVFIEDSVLDYILRWVVATRKHDHFLIGISPRGAIALRRVAQARALVEGRNYVIPSDVDRSIRPVFAHRIVSNRSRGSDRIPGVGFVEAELSAIAQSIELP